VILFAEFAMELSGLPLVLEQAGANIIAKLVIELGGLSFALEQTGSHNLSLCDTW
jgi:hypothetical protein